MEAGSGASEPYLIVAQLLQMVSMGVVALGLGPARSERNGLQMRGAFKWGLKKATEALKQGTRTWART